MRKRRRRGRGEGAIGKRDDGRWYARLDLGPRPKLDAAGRPVCRDDGSVIYVRARKTVYARTRGAVVRKLDKAQRDREQGLALASDRQTVGQFLELWLEHVARPKLRPRTYNTYESAIRLHLVPELGSVRLQALTPQRVQAWIGAHQAAGASAQRCTAARSVLRVALNTAVGWGLLLRNPAGGKLVTLPRVTKRPITPLSPDQARALLAAVTGHRHEALYTTALACGLRIGEALALTWAQVDLDAGRLSVVQALQRIGGDPTKRRAAFRDYRRLCRLLADTTPAPGTKDAARAELARLLPERRALRAALADATDQVTADQARAALARNAVARGRALVGLKVWPADLVREGIRAARAAARAALAAQKTTPTAGETKTARSRRTIPLPAVVVAALERHRTDLRRLRLAMGKRWQEQGLVFPSRHGTPGDARNIGSELKRILRRAGLPEIRFHDLRHTAATLMLVQGVGPRTIMETLGHSQISLTLDTYSHVLPALQDDAAAKMDAVLKGRA